MALYDRLMGLGGIKIPVHGFQATLAEFGRGTLTGAQAQAVIGAMSGEVLTPAEVTEAQALLATISGSVSAKLARVVEIDHVLLLAEHRAPGYDTAAAVQARLGV
jgi:hypothetical protein